MKLKGLGKRAYNVIFHTHTVAGIVISVAIYVIFYAGAFSLFRHDIQQWENPDARRPVPDSIDIDKALSQVDSVYHLDWHAVTNVVLPGEEAPYIKVYGAVHDTDSTNKRMAAYVVPGKIQDMKNPKTMLGDTIYYLHYFRQIPIIGLYLSGLVGLFFLFATITGLLIHWRNLITKFFAFFTTAKWKTIWTNAHTVLGVIGLPFQVMYAVTGAFFGLLTLILLPSVLLLYNGDTSKVYNYVQPWMAIEIPHENTSSDHISLNELKYKVDSLYPALNAERVIIRNYRSENGLATWLLRDEGIASAAYVTMRLKDASIIPEASILPESKTYSDSVIEVLGNLHFGHFGGLLIRVVYFILSMITCFMIISGVMIWRTARDTNQYTLKQRIFHHKVTKIYLSICLSMFPAFAIIFIANKLVPFEVNSRVEIVNMIFFGSWLLLAVIGSFWNNYSLQNRNFLLTGGIFSLVIPLINGWVTGDWFWKVYKSLPGVAYIDIFWLMAGLTSLILVFKVLKVKSTSDHPTHYIESTEIPEAQKSNVIA